MSQILADGPVYRTTETAAVVGSPVRTYSRYGGRSSMLMFLVLLLLLAWMYATRGLGSLGFGVNREPARVTWPSTSATPYSATPYIEPPVAVTTEIAPVPLPATAQTTTVVTPVDVRISEQSRPVQLPATVAPGTVGLSSDYIASARVAADNVNMRTGPSENYRAAVVLPRGWDVYIMRQSHTDNYGETWIEVSVNTNQGIQKGWINRRYLAAI